MKGYIWKGYVIMDNYYTLPSERHPDGLMYMADNLLDGFTVSQVVNALHNEPGPLTEEALKKVVNDMLATQLEDLWAIVNENDEEIIAAAYKGREDDPYKVPVFDMDWADRAEALANDIYTWCLGHDCWQDVYIYYNGKRMGTSGKDKTGKTVYRYGGTPFIEDNMDPRDYFAYVREPNILSMSFEGALYDILNNHDMFALQDLFSKYGLYYESGNAWNLSAYPIDE